MKGFETRVSGELDEPKTYLTENVQKDENRDNITEKDVTTNELEKPMEIHFSSEDSSKQKDVEKIEMNSNSDLDLQILELIEKSWNGVWKCKVCGKTTKQLCHIKEHAETHIEGMSHACNICNKMFPNRKSLRNHTYKNHRTL